MLAMNKELTAEQRLHKAVSDIMNNEKYRALAGVLMMGNKGIVEHIPTACTNGRDEMYGRAFVDSLTDAEFRFVILHECYHKLYKHLTTWNFLWKENAGLANAACDYCINIKIADDNEDGFAKMPMKDGKPFGLIDAEYRHMDSLQIYNLLKKESPPQGGESGEGSEGGEGQGSGPPQGFDDHDWEGAQELSEEEKRELARDLDEAIRQGALMAGKTGSGGNRDLDQLLKPEVDWREVLREFITTTCQGNDYSTWKKPNRRFIASGHYLPSGVSEKVDELVLAIDTSGSVGADELRRFLSEVAGIAETVKPRCVRLLYWDARVCREETYDETQLANIAQSTKPAGGGGTTVECVPEHMQEHGINPQAVIVLTDGYLGSWGTWSCPVLWCIVNNSSAQPSVGKKVNVKS